MRCVRFSAEVFILLLAAASPNAVWGQTLQPTITAVTNAASYANGPISPGEMVVIFGNGMGPSNVVGFQLDQQGRVANTLSQVQVLFDGNAAPLIYVSATQISAMVPYGVAGESSTQIQVAYQGSTSVSFQKPIAPSAPGIFTADSSGQGQAAMANSDGSYNTAANPATPGSYVTFYLTGGGQTAPPGSDGIIATSTANVVLPVTVLIAGRTVQLLYAGSAPGNVNGFCQINAVIPADVQYGGNLPLVVQIGGVSSQTSVTLAVSGPPAPVPGAPQNPTASVNSSGQVVLTWTPADSLATQFHIERQNAGAGFTEIAVIQASATTFTDANVTPGTAYGYRIRAANDYGFSTYSAVVNATVPVAQLPPPAPTLQATAISSSQVHLTWSTTATGIVLFSVERRTTTGAYSQISQPPATSTSYDDSGLTESTTYLYRMRVQTGAGFSPYSNEVTVTTLQALPAAPTNLQATAVSSTQVNLTWRNNAPDATAVRVEYLPPSSTTFTDIGPAATLTSAGITNLQPNTAYSFRVRAQNAVGYSAYSNVASVTTLPVSTTVFLIHGIGQSSADMQGLYGSLTGSSGIDLTRFQVDPGFDFSKCANTDFCDDATCSISAGAQKLAQYIANANPLGNIILIGFSMGGLIARDMMANGRLILNGRKISALITLGTPNLGYPYTLADTLVFCTPLVQEMNGNWRAQQSTNTVVLSPYLLSLTNQWSSTSYPGNTATWLAASGRSCSNAVRTIDPTTGCRDANPYSDGVVCDDSATYFVSTPSGTTPNQYWQDPGQIYVHSNYGWGIGTSFVLCGNSGNPVLNPPLSNPPSFGPLFAAIKGLINGLSY
jgi:uncharacterized protein (TIGR03437 family)